MSSRFLAYVAIALTSIWPVSAQGDRASPHVPDRPYIQATGEATISVKPDQAVVEIGVVSEGATAAAVAAQNAKQTGEVLAELKDSLGSGQNLKTTSYSVRPNYRFPKPGAEPTITGYTATNMVEVTLDDLAQTGKVIDFATRSGANVIRNVQYQLKDPGAVRARVLQQAAARAKISAEAIAAGLGIKIARIFSAEEITQGGDFVMPRMAPAAKSSAVATPMEVGTIEVTGRVMVRVEVAQ
jgi:uncharacterized protein